MRTNKKKVFEDLDPFKLERAKTVDIYSIEALIAKVRNSGILDESQMPEWIVNYPMPDNVIQCPDDPFKCYARLLKIQKEDGINVHPANQIDVLITESSVTVSDVGIAYGSGDSTKTISTVCSYLMSDTNDVEKLCHASTADLMVTDAKYSKDGQIVIVEWPKQFGVPISDAVKYRDMSGSNAPGRAVAREEIFAFLSKEKNSLLGVRLHSLIGNTMKNFTEIEGLADQIKETYLKKGATVPDDFCTKVIGIQGGVVPWTDDVEHAYRMYFKSISMRGGREGKNVAHGFERFSMSRCNAHMLNLVTDIKVMLSRYNSSTILIKNKGLTPEEMRVLVANKVSIVVAGTPYEEQKINVPGVYGKSHPQARAVEFFKIDDDWIKPDLVAKKEKDSPIKFGQYYDNACTMMSKRNRCFSYIYLDSRLKDYADKLSLFPSCTADTLQVIIATGLQDTFKIADLLKRGTQAISCRNRFVHCRKPFCAIDTMASEVRWDMKVILPRLKCKDKKKVVDCTLFTGEEEVEVVPPLVDIQKIRNRVEQAKKERLRGYDCVVAAVTSDKIYLFKIMMGISQDYPMFYVADISGEWRKQFGDILNMTEELILGMLTAHDDNLVAEYKTYYKQNYRERIPFDVDERVPVRSPSAAPPVAPEVATTGRLKLRVDPSKRIKKKKRSSSEDDDDDPTE